MQQSVREREGARSSLVVGSAPNGGARVRRCLSCFFRCLSWMNAMQASSVKECFEALQNTSVMCKAVG